MAIKEQVVAELENLDDEHLSIVFRLIQSLKAPHPADQEGESWGEFIAATYGCIADAPIERGEQ